MNELYIRSLQIAYAATNVPHMETRNQRQQRIDTYHAAVSQLQAIQQARNAGAQCAVNDVQPSGADASATVLIIDTGTPAASGTSSPAVPSSTRSPLPQDSPVRDGSVPPSPVEEEYDAVYSGIPDDVAVSISRPEVVSGEDVATVLPRADELSSAAPVPREHVACMPPPPPRKPKRKFKGHNWSSKGTKSSRAARKLRMPPSGPSVPSSTVSAPRAASSSSASCAKSVPFDQSVPVRFNHGPRSDLAFHSASVSVRETTDHVSSSPVFSHPTGLTMSRHMRSARSVYAYAHGLHTTLHYPQVFSVRLLGEPSTVQDGTRAPVHTVGDESASRAIAETLRVVTDLDSHPRSLCNHASCIYNQGDAVTRRHRHQLSIGYLNQLLQRNEHSIPATATKPSPDPPSGDGTGSALVTAPRSGVRTVLDSGASRHLETNATKLSGMRSCAPVTLQGISGKPVTVAVEGAVDNCTNVLHAPGASASVRSVSALLDSHGLPVLFSARAAHLLPADFVIPPAAPVVADRREDGLFHVRPGTIPPPPSSQTATAYLSIPQQIKREQVHRLHRTLGHASPSRKCPKLSRRALKLRLR